MSKKKKNVKKDDRKSERHNKRTEVTELFEDQTMRVFGIGFFSVLLLMILVFNFIYRSNSNVSRSEQRISKVLTEPARYYGSRILVTGKVDSIIGVKTFTIDEPQPFPQKLLVISRQPLQPVGGAGNDDYIFNQGDRVSAEGKVERFSLRDIESELNTDLVDSQFVSWEGKPVLIADSVESER